MRLFGRVGSLFWDLIGFVRVQDIAQPSLRCLVIRLKSYGSSCETKLSPCFFEFCVLILVCRTEISTLRTYLIVPLIRLILGLSLWHVEPYFSLLYSVRHFKYKYVRNLLSFHTAG